MAVLALLFLFGTFVFGMFVFLSIGLSFGIFTDGAKRKDLENGGAVERFLAKWHKD